jgi:hypothetical protein
VLIAGGCGDVSVNVVEPNAPAKFVAIGLNTVAVKYVPIVTVMRPVLELIETPAGTALPSPFVMLHAIGAESVDATDAVTVYATLDTSIETDVNALTTGRRGAETLNVVGTDN